MVNKIIIEETLTKNIKTGVGKHTIMLNALISELGFDYEIVVNNFISEISNPLLKRVLYILWLNTFFILKLLFQSEGTTVIYTSFLPFVKLKKIIQIGIIHDVLLKIHPTKMTKLAKLNNVVLNILIKFKADKILSVSNTVKNEIVKYYDIPTNKIYVLYNTLSLDKHIILNESSVLKKFNLEKSRKKYIISVSSLNKNKNIRCLVDAYEKLQKEFSDIKLVLVGGKLSVLSSYKNLINNEHVIFTGHVSDEELKVLYKNALMFVFPSIYEGFGIPILDAQLFEIPVICSDISIFREIGKDSVEYSTPTSDEFYISMKKLLNSKSKCQVLVDNGNCNLKRFTNSNLKQQLQTVLNLQ